ncbi:MAG: NADH-quinone oxidoreductase subunit L [Methanocalculaceae archaeon]|jgi:ech hydrogenase subunit A|nr:NADH-quinone oxidoreductase subunit L [Methanocalculaceae archaeon]
MYTQNLTAILILLLVPLFAATLLAVQNRDAIRDCIVGATSAVIVGTSLYLTWAAWTKPIAIDLVSAKEINLGLCIVELIIALAIIGLSIKYLRVLPAILGFIQLALVGIIELFYADSVSVATTFIVNDLTAVMILIIGIIGTLICVYALGYMKDYHHHHAEIPERKPYFFAMLFIFLSAMFGIVLSNSLMWILCFWEVTTLCSFLLIGYSKTPEAVTNSFRAVWMNLIGGIAFTLAIICLLEIEPSGAHLLSISNIIIYPDMTALTIPAAFIAIAGLTKAAQMPFSTWLTGAMVAPTPVSALLHSSTMVKAGVYLLVIFSPIFSHTMVGIMLAFIGAFTFFVTSALAISQSNAKKVLAYSTIANLGLITACAGIGTPESVMAAILLIIFHAVAKGLLFMCVGAVEHRISSRDIEDMDGLLVRLPLLATMMVIGICGMYLAPFGMLIAKWAALVAFLSVPFGWACVILLAFGSAFTLFFWTKWLGKLFMRMNRPAAPETLLRVSEKISVIGTGVLTLICSVGFFFIIYLFIDPYLTSIYKEYSDSMEILVFDNLLMIVLMFVILAILVTAAHFGHVPGRTLSPYLSGRGVDEYGRFRGSLGVYKEAKSANYYMVEYCGEEVLMRPSWVISITLIIILFALAFLEVML